MIAGEIRPDNMGVVCSCDEGTMASHGNGASGGIVGSGDNALIPFFFYLRDDLRRVHQKSARPLFSDIKEFCGKGLGVRLSCRCAEDGLESQLMFCYDHADESFTVFYSPLMAGMFQKEAGRPYVCFEACAYAPFKIFSRVGVVAFVGCECEA